MPTADPADPARAGGVLAARRLQRPAARRSERRFLVEGPQAVGAAAAAGVLLEVFCTAEARSRYEALSPPPGVHVTEVGQRALASLADTLSPQGMVGVAATVDVPLEQALGRAPRLVVVLVDPRDPGNTGTVIRTADAAGADAVVLAVGPDGGAVDPHNGKCVRSSAGSLFHVPIALAPLAALVPALRSAGLRLIAADARGADLDEAMGLERPTAWLLGNEAHGLPAGLDVDERLRVPIHGRAESLNLASAAAVCLYASARAQRRSGAAAGGKG